MAPKRTTRSSKVAPAPPAKKVAFATVEEHHEIPPLEEDQHGSSNYHNQSSWKPGNLKFNYALYAYDLEM